jgi:hypothetical protein
MIYITYRPYVYTKGGEFSTSLFDFRSDFDDFYKIQNPAELPLVSSTAVAGGERRISTPVKQAQEQKEWFRASAFRQEQIRFRLCSGRSVGASSC